MNPIDAILDGVRNLARYKFHGGYSWAAVADDGGLICIECLRANYRQIFAATREQRGDGWQIIGSANSGEHDSDSGPEMCANCNRVLWGDTD